jgi:glycosyltransferase involved in cell wall biosynthesis
MTPARNITCIYANTPGFSGQRFASEILVDGLRERGWDVQVILTPTQNRLADSPRLSAITSAMTMTIQLAYAWLRSLGIALYPRLLHVNLGQTYFSMIREGLPLLMRSLLGMHRGRAVVSLHGHVFLGWDVNSREARMLRRMAKAVSFITILGPKQKQALVDLGIPSNKVVVMDNTCLLSPISDEECRRKQILASGEPVQVLYLSSLIETKGYPDFVEGICLLAKHGQVHLNATLCGKIAVDGMSSRFPNHTAAETWLREKLNEVNRSERVRLKWVNGAQGEVKDELFRQAHVFILPSRYRVEAQPIAILEAFASGCAVITTPVGEIPAMMRVESAVLLPDPTGEAICGAIKRLAEDTGQRQAIALSGLHDFQTRFSHERHMANWESLLLPLLDQ